MIVGIPCLITLRARQLAPKKFVDDAVRRFGMPEDREQVAGTWERVEAAANAVLLTAYDQGTPRGHDLALRALHAPDLDNRGEKN